MGTVGRGDVILTAKAPDEVILAPHNMEAEEKVLGCLMYDPDEILQVAHILKPEDFFLQRHRWVYEAILHLHEEGKPFGDTFILGEELKAKGHLDDIGGYAYLTSFLLNIQFLSSVPHYVDMVKKTSLLRQTIELAQELTVLAFRGDLSPDEILSKANEMLMAISEKTVKNGGLRMFSNVLSDLLDQTELASKGGIATISTGSPSLDNLIDYMCRGDYIILAARPSMGKTAAAMNIGKSCALQGFHVAAFSAEMKDLQLAARIIAGDSGIPTNRIRKGKMTEDQWQSFFSAIEKNNSLPIAIDDTMGIDVKEIYNRVRRAKQLWGVDVVIVDYIQLLSTGKKHFLNNNEKVTYISFWLKKIARDLDVVVIALSQLSRNLEQRNDKRPMLSDLRDSGAVEQDADVVLFIYRDDVYNPDTEFPNIAEFLCAKNRNGAAQTKELLWFDKVRQMFIDLETNVTKLNEEPPAIPTPQNTTNW